MSSDGAAYDALAPGTASATEFFAEVERRYAALALRHAELLRGVDEANAEIIRLRREQTEALGQHGTTSVVEYLKNDALLAAPDVNEQGKNLTVDQKKAWVTKQIAESDEIKRLVAEEQRYRDMIQRHQDGIAAAQQELPVLRLHMEHLNAWIGWSQARQMARPQSRPPRMRYARTFNQGNYESEHIGLEEDIGANVPLSEVKARLAQQAEALRSPTVAQRMGRG